MLHLAWKSSDTPVKDYSLHCRRALSGLEPAPRQAGELGNMGPQWTVPPGVVPPGVDPLGLGGQIVAILGQDRLFECSIITKLKQ